MTGAGSPAFLSRGAGDSRDLKTLEAVLVAPPICPTAQPGLHSSVDFFCAGWDTFAFFRAHQPRLLFAEVERISCKGRGRVDCGGLSSIIRSLFLAADLGRRPHFCVHGGSSTATVRLSSPALDFCDPDVGTGDLASPLVLGPALHPCVWATFSSG